MEQEMGLMCMLLASEGDNRLNDDGYKRETKKTTKREEATVSEFN